MAKTKISEYSSTANSNTDIASINIDEGCAPSGINNAIRALMAQIHDLYAGTSGDTWPVTAGGTGSGTASGARTNLGLVIGTDVQAYDADLAEIASSGKGAEIASYGTYGVGFKNRIINGDMRIDQRNAGASVTVNSVAFNYTLDRWFGYGQVADGVFTFQRSTTAPTGFTNSALLTVTTADASIGSAQVYGFGQKIEGFNVADFGWGTASAQNVTLSFQVRSSVTGTYSVTFFNGAFNRGYTATFNIAAANTFETKTITIPGDTSGTWTTDNSNGLTIWISLGTGSTYTGTAGTWNAGTTYAATGQINLISTNGATFYITGVQLEKGSTATSFDYRPYGTELALCQRYYFKVNAEANGQDYAIGWNASTTETRTTFYFPVSMRIAPSSLEQSGTAGDYSVRHGVTATICSAVPAFHGSSKNSGITVLTVASGLTAGQGSNLRPINTNAFLAWSAEL